MIEMFGYRLAADDPRLLAGLAAAALMLLVLWLLLRTQRAAAQSSRLAEPMLRAVAEMSLRVQDLSNGQQQLSGGLTQVSQAQAAAQARVLALMENRLAEVSRGMADSLNGSATRTAHSLGELRQRLETIDRAQANIEKLSGNVLGLQDILSNKQTRGAFGEIQLHDIVQKALPPDAFTMQATLSNGRRADCLIRLPDPPGPLVIDSKFPLEAYEALRKAATPAEQAEAARALRQAVRTHIRAIAERYILPGETADGALMFLPSEAVYAELHANFGDVVREGFAARVWIVSPTTCMATLNTLRAVLKDARMREQAGAIRATLRLLHRDVEMIAERVGRLVTHFDQARGDLDGIATAAERAGRRADRLEGFEFDGAPQPGAPATATPADPPRDGG